MQNIKWGDTTKMTRIEAICTLDSDNQFVVEVGNARFKFILNDKPELSFTVIYTNCTQKQAAKIKMKAQDVKITAEKLKFFSQSDTTSELEFCYIRSNELPPAFKVVIHLEKIIENKFAINNILAENSEKPKSNNLYHQNTHPSIDPLPSLIYHNETESNKYVGLQNQGATCYMNSMLQALFHLPKFRRLIYEMDSTAENKSDVENIPKNLQFLFAKMQTSTEACSTTSLTKSFGWDPFEVGRQHDVQEFCRVIIDNIESKMEKQENLKGEISKLFCGTYQNYIRCQNVEYQTTKNEKFYDLSLIVKGCSSLEDSFFKYIEKEVLSDLYETEAFGKQKAEMGIEFLNFPPVLHIHLRRFEYDFNSGLNTKINSIFRYPQVIDLDKFVTIDGDRSHSNVFHLFGVLVHKGSSNFGHYFAYLRPTADPQFYRFEDSSVTPAKLTEVLEDNFGSSVDIGRPEQYSIFSTRSNYFPISSFSSGLSSNAYMLIYIREDMIDDIYQPVPNEMIPPYIAEEERKKEEESKKVSFTVIRKVDIMNSDIKLNIYSQNIEYPTIAVIADPYELGCDLYNEVGKTFGISNFDLYLIRRPYNSIETHIENNANPVFASFATTNSNQSKDVHQRVIYVHEHEPLDDCESKFLASIFVYIRALINPIRFLTTVLIDLDKPISVIFDVFRNAFNVPDNVPLLIYKGSPYSIDKIDSMVNDENRTFKSLLFYGNCKFLVQIDYKNIIFKLKQTIYYDDKIEIDKYNFLHNTKIHPKTAMRYLNYSKSMQEFSVVFDDMNIKVKVPNSFTYNKFLSFLMKATQLGSSPDLIVSYTKNGKTPLEGLGDISLLEIETKHNIKLSNCYLYSCFDREQAEQYKTLQRVTFCILDYPKFSDLNYVFLSPTQKLENITDHAKTRNIVPKNCHLRCLKVKNERILKIIGKESIIATLPNPLIFEIIPDDQVGGGKLARIELKTATNSKDKFIPFIFKLNENERFSITRTRLTLLIHQQNEHYQISKVEYNSQGLIVTVDDSFVLYDLCNINTLTEITITLTERENSALKIYN